MIDLSPRNVLIVKNNPHRALRALDRIANDRHSFVVVNNTCVFVYDEIRIIEISTGYRLKISSLSSS